MSLREMAENGYGHWLRKAIPQQQLRTESFEAKAQKAREDLEYYTKAVIRSGESEEEYERELNEINRLYSDIEPKRELAQ